MEIWVVVAGQQIDGSTINVSLSYTASPKLHLFEGRQARRTTVTNIVRRDGVVIASNGSQWFWINDPQHKSGGFVQANGNYWMFDTVITAPADARVGEAGGMFVGKQYLNSSKQTESGQITGNWSLEPSPRANRAYLCMTMQRREDFGMNVNESWCWEITPQGEITGSRMTLTINGQTFTFQ